MNTFFPATGTEAEWNCACYRLEDYLRALRVQDRVHLSQLMLRILESAAERHAEDPSQNPTSLVMEEARSLIDRWFEAVLGQRNRLEVEGMISMLAADATTRWPRAFLAEEIPVEFQRHMQECHVQAGPDLQVSSMVPRPIDVSPMLDSLHLNAVMEKARWSAAFLMVGLGAALSFSVYLFTR